MVMVMVMVMDRVVEMECGGDGDGNGGLDMGTEINAHNNSSMEHIVIKSRENLIPNIKLMHEFDLFRCGFGYAVGSTIVVFIGITTANMKGFGQFLAKLLRETTWRWRW